MEKCWTNTVEGLTLHVWPTAQAQPGIKFGVFTGDTGLLYTSGDELRLAK